MKNYKFKIGKKELELVSASVESAYTSAQYFQLCFGWKGKIILIN